MPARKAMALDLREHFDPEGQILAIQQLARERGKDRGWGFGRVDIARLESPPTVSAGCKNPILGLGVSLASPHQTAVEACAFMARSLEMESYIPGDPSKLRLLDGVPFEPNTLSWFVLDYGKPLTERQVFADVRGPNSAHSQVLWAAGHYPKEWVQRIGQSGVPDVAMLGYEFKLGLRTVGEPPDWRYAAALGWNGINSPDRATISTPWTKTIRYSHMVPVVVVG